MEKKIIVVDENDQVIGVKNRSDITANDIYRVAALWIRNSKGEILLAKRHLSKEHDPGKWGPAVAGTVDEGESYEQNIYRETEEELGLKKVVFKKGPKMEVKSQHHFFCQWYLLNIDRKIRDFIIQKDEVEEIMWFEKNVLLKELISHPERFLVNMEKYTTELDLY